MTVRKRIAGLLSVIGLLAGGFAITTVAASAAPQTEAQAPRPQVAVEAVEAKAWHGRCRPGRVCFYTGRNGRGDRCMWRHKDPKWLGGAIQCEWSDTRDTKSIWNRKGGYDCVVYYYNNRYGNKIGSTGSGSRGNFEGEFAPKSHRWREADTGDCG